MFKIFKLIEIYNKFRKQSYFFSSPNKNVSIKIDDARVTEVYFNVQNPSAQDVKEAMNQAVDHITAEVKQTFGF